MKGVTKHLLTFASLYQDEIFKHFLLLNPHTYHTYFKVLRAKAKLNCSHCNINQLEKLEAAKEA